MDDRAAEAGGLAPANIDHYNFVKIHKELEEQKLRTGEDIHLVLRPIGVLRKPGEVVQARIVCVLPENAAEIMAFAAKRGQAVRLATADEIKAYKDYNAKLKQVAEGRVAQEQQRIAQVHLQAVLGQAATAANVPAIPQEEVPPEPTAPLAVPTPSDGLESPVKPEGAAAEVPPPSGGPVDPDIAKLGNEKQVSLLVQGGYVTVDQVAEASPEDLTQIKGIGAKTAAQILVKANQVQAEREESAEDTKE
jgi:DNA uptake protein ComE-like DNA-binding protein